MGLKDCYAAIPRQWKFPKVIIYLFVIELVIEVAALALYGIAQPDLYRTRLWKEGSDHGWNSNPNSIIYAYANYRPVHTPLPWSQFVTDYNVVISVVALFLLLCKAIMYICHIFYPLLSTPIHAALIAIYAVSINAQAAADMSDPEHPQPGAPWYITRGCGAPVEPRLQGYCKQAQASFAVTILLCALFFIYFVLSIWSLLAPVTRRNRKLSTASSEDAESQSQRPWEMTQVFPPPTPGTSGGLKSPMTPRTTAFNTLSGKMGGTKEKKKTRMGKGKGKETQTEVIRGPDGKVPLRHHISMGDQVYESPRGNT
ncbi:MAG: hypothetical protein Q9221_003523 [Calogaya cf. arnoldii]